MMNKSAIWAVLTGDIVDFPRLSAAAHDVLKTAMLESFAALDKAFDRDFTLPIDVVRADYWQIATPHPHIALRAALYYRAELKARMGSVGTYNVDTRIAIGVGLLDVEPRRRVSDGDGPAYERSARALDTMQRTRRLALRLEDQPLSPGFDEMLGLVDHVVGRWTGKQALAVTGALQGWTQERIAGGWGRVVGQAATSRQAGSRQAVSQQTDSQQAVSQQSVSEQSVSQQTVAQHLHRAGWQALAPAVDFLEGLLA